MSPGKRGPAPSSASPKASVHQPEGALSFGSSSPAPVQVRREARILPEQGIVEIPLTQGQVAIIDAADAEKALAHIWRADKALHTWRVETRPPSGGPRASIYLHRLILESASGMEVNHVNGNGLDNRRSNLRFATRSQTSQAASVRSDNKSGLKGVSWNKGGRKWEAGIRVNGVKIHLGLFHSKEDAGAAYDRAAIQFFGEFARINGAQANGEAAA